MAPKQKPGQSKQDYGTPPEFLIAAKRLLGIESFVCDVAASKENACAPVFITKAENALEQNWWVLGGWMWLNPEFADIMPWVRKAHLQALMGVKTAVLLPASVGANWWKLWVDGKCRIIPLNGRITFVDPQGEPLIQYPNDCALLLYGDKEQALGYAEPWTWMESLTEEERDVAKKRQKAAKQPAKPRLVKKQDGEVAAESGNGRVTTFDGHSSSSVEVAPAPANSVVRPIQLPEPDDAVRVLKELAELNDRAIVAQSHYEELKEAAKSAKDKFDKLAEQVLNRLHQATHKSDLPLFSQDQREDDQRKMEQAAVSTPPVAPETSSVAEGDQTEAEPEIVAPAAAVLAPQAPDGELSIF